MPIVRLRWLVVALLDSVVATFVLPVAAAAPQHYCFGMPATIVGTDGDDVLKGTGGPDVIVALGGRDRVRGRGGDDRICLGRGGTPRGVEWGMGDAGNDRIDGGHGSEFLDGGAGNDVLDGQRGDDQLQGAGGNDLLIGGPGDDTLVAGDGSDDILGGEGADQSFGGAGDDLVAGGGGKDYANGGQGDDLVRGGAGPDLLEGDGGDDDISGGRHSDTVSFAGRNGGSSDNGRPVDVDLGAAVATGLGHDRLRGIENIFGGAGPDTLVGDEGPNVIIGNHGDDELSGAGGNDCIALGRGQGRIDGGPGIDLVTANIRPKLHRSCVPSNESGTVSPWDPLTGVTIDLAQGYAAFDDPGDERTSLDGVEGALGSWEQDTLIGDDLANQLFGLGDWDHIEGRGGDDHLDAGPGAVQTIDGGPGTDTCLNAQSYVACEETDPPPTFLSPELPQHRMESRRTVNAFHAPYAK